MYIMRYYDGRKGRRKIYHRSSNLPVENEHFFLNFSSILATGMPTGIASFLPFRFHSFSSQHTE